MVIRTLQTTLLQGGFCKIILNCNVIVKSIVAPDCNFASNSLMGQFGIGYQVCKIGYSDFLQ